MHSIPPSASSNTLSSAMWLWSRAIAATRSSGSCTSMAPISRFTSNTLPGVMPARVRSATVCGRDSRALWQFTQAWLTAGSARM